MSDADFHFSPVYRVWAFKNAGAGKRSVLSNSSRAESTRQPLHIHLTMPSSVNHPDEAEDEEFSCAG
jgi:hypothetical protein